MIAQSYLDFQAQMLHPKNLFVFILWFIKIKFLETEILKKFVKMGQDKSNPG